MPLHRVSTGVGPRPGIARTEWLVVHGIRVDRVGRPYHPRSPLSRAHLPINSLVPRIVTAHQPVTKSHHLFGVGKSDCRPLPSPSAFMNSVRPVRKSTQRPGGATIPVPGSGPLNCLLSWVSVLIGANYERLSHPSLVQGAVHNPQGLDRVL